MSKYVGGMPDFEQTKFNREELYDQIKSMVNLDIASINFQKNPKDQEASVAAIFYQLIGSKDITDIKPIISGYRNKYDLYAKINNFTNIIEFKSSLSNVIKDFNDAKKLFDEIDYLVCWDINDDDKQKFHNFNIVIEEIRRSSLNPIPSNHSVAATHKLILSGISNPIYVIDLKKLVSSFIPSNQ